MLYDMTVTQFSKMLLNLSAMLDKAVAHGEAKKFDPTVLLTSRLAPDQFTFLRQVQIACDTAQVGVARLTGLEAPAHENQEATIDELRARIEGTVAWLAAVSPDAFATAVDQHVTQPRWAGKWLTGGEFATMHMIPNFYFHVTTAYSILRHNGVDVGKRAYLGAMPYRD